MGYTSSYVLIIASREAFGKLIIDTLNLDG